MTLRWAPSGSTFHEHLLVRCGHSVTPLSSHPNPVSHRHVQSLPCLPTEQALCCLPRPSRSTLATGCRYLFLPASPQGSGNLSSNCHRVPSPYLLSPQYTPFETAPIDQVPSYSTSPPGSVFAAPGIDLGSLLSPPGMLVFSHLLAALRAHLVPCRPTSSNSGTGWYVLEQLRGRPGLTVSPFWHCQYP